MPRRRAYLASITDALLIGSHLVDATHQLPPAGYSWSWWKRGLPEPDLAFPYGEIALPVGVAFDAPDEGPHGWWWATLGDMILHLPPGVDSAFGLWLDRLAGLLGSSVGALLDAPVVVKGIGDSPMRWIETTHRGLLFGEQFQHHLAWGKPGDDPTTTEAEALTLADSLATAWSTTMASSLLVAFSPDVVYTEVGVVELNQDDPEGHVSESYGTQWSMYPTAERPTGGAATTSLPYEVACCVSLQTDQRGARGKGRFYLPPFSKDAITVHGLFNMGVVSPVIAAIGNYIDDVKASTDLVPIVVSRKFRVLNEVTSINCGVVPDSQRRRRRSISEARVPEWTAS